jgi:O-glycosyl hydrolase
MNLRVLSVCFGLIVSPGLAQPELMQWGNLRGLREAGHLHAFETSLQVLGADGSVAARTGHYAHKSAYTRSGETQRVVVGLGGVDCTEEVTATGPRGARVSVTMTATADGAGAAMFAVDLPWADFGTGSVGDLAVADLGSGRVLHTASLRAAGAGRAVKVRTDAPADVQLAVAMENGAKVLRLRFPVLAGPFKAGQAASRTFELTAEGELDHRPVHVAVDATRPGRAFTGVGGNFRLQFPASDPAIIDYNLEHIRVTWGRIALWWRDWDADESADPLAAARAGQVTERIRNQIALARRLAARGLPVIVSVWDPPAWANRAGPRPAGMYTDPVSPAKVDRMAASIAAYLQFLKESAGVEAALFSFNEPDLGLVPEPALHVAIIKALGRECVARGLATKHLLADTSNATPKALAYAQAAIDDLESRPFLGAVGFHTWGGCENENLVAWSEAARKLGLPLLVTEGGPDAEAHKHPDMFLEPAYALDEIELYVRIGAVAQPAAILHWQLTADYTLLKGGGAYGHAGPLEPTTRFWNYRQLGETPAGAFALLARSDHPLVTAAAFGDLARGAYAIHLVNTGAARRAEVTGLPATLRKLRVLRAGPEAPTEVPVTNGRAEVMLSPAGLTSLMGETSESAAP